MLTATGISIIASALLSLALNYIPGLDTVWAGLDSKKKQLWIIGLMFLIVAVVFGLNCAKLFSKYIPATTCDLVGAQDAFVAFLLAWAVGQGVNNGTKYMLSSKVMKIRATK